jgi:cellobionic acid phosphorylase
MPFAEGVDQIPINAIPHKDINAWGPYAVHVYVAETGDQSILDESIAFADVPSQSATLYEHVCLGLDWLLRDRTGRGLCRLGQGDWCDPLNMAGLEERGESVWLSQALAFALESWAELARFRGDARSAQRYRLHAAKLRDAVNELGWDGEWYGRGFNDDGEAFGVSACAFGKIFLNAQSWAIMCGAADGERAAACSGAVERMLMTPAGPMTLAPAFTGMDEKIGKLSQKVPGWNENGSVYCHAATFYAYALYCLGDADRAFAVLRALLPGGGENTLQRAGQLPLYVPNFYRGADAGRKAGLSSHAPNTGTAAWYYHTAVTQLFGLRAELDGLRMDPKLPTGWDRVQVLRRWRGAEFDVSIRRGADGEAAGVVLDGSPLANDLVPVQEPGTKHRVEVVIA